MCNFGLRYGAAGKKEQQPRGLSELDKEMLQFYDAHTEKQIYNNANAYLLTKEGEKRICDVYKPVAGSEILSF